MGNLRKSTSEVRLGKLQTPQYCFVVMILISITRYIVVISGRTMGDAQECLYGD